MTSILLVQELSHCYKHMSSESKLDSHIYAIVLLYCLQHSYGTVFSIDGVCMSQVVLALYVCARMSMCVSICISIHDRTIINMCTRIFFQSDGEVFVEESNLF